MRTYPKLKTDLLLCGIYLVCIALLTYCYPAPHITWDSFYYIEISHDLRPAIRPIGYPYFLKSLNGISWSLPLVVSCQYLLHFLSVWFLMRVTDRIFHFSNKQYFLLGFILLTEPVALYHCFSILSDVLFSSLSLAYIATLLLLIRKRNIWLFILHVALLFACIEVRHIAVYYPYFSFALLVYYHRDLKLVLIYGVVIFGMQYAITQLHISASKNRYGLAVVNPFAGWTYANNALYTLPYIHLDTNDIEDAEIRRLHSFCSNYMDTSGFKVKDIGSGFLWDPESPLCVLRKKTEDSLHVNSFHAWYLLCGGYGKYGMYLQRHYPLAYIKGYIIPNTQTLINPHSGEMQDYYLLPKLDSIMLGWYHKQPADFHVRHQVYKDFLNDWNNRYYQGRLLLFTFAVVAAIIYRKRMGKQTTQLLIPLILFTCMFYALTLYSSWFMQRYLLPVIPLQVVVIFIVIITVMRKPLNT